jgi:DNA invertase Pin-like site-specific DNA recombinase
MSEVERSKELMLPAAQYLRASTEHQQYSTANQSQAIAEYATEHNFEVTQSYVDDAKSGLGLKHRQGLQRLIQDAVAGTAEYKAILVYDVSRWGRFLDTDESAHYEFLCKSAGVPVHYCAESFGNDPTLPNLIMKAVKRTMAGEYSRELSAKVTRGPERIVRNGYRSGGVPGYGLRRLLLASDGSRKQQLKLNERKSVSSDRVVYELGPPEEVECVREIYRMYAEARMTSASIARTLNARGVPVHFKYGQWTHYAVRTILAHPKYTGSLVYNRTTRRLQTPAHNLPKSEWLMVPNAFEGIVDSATYEKAQAIRYANVWNRTDSELLDRLRIVLQENGKLSTEILHHHLDAPSAKTCKSRFGSLTKAYELIGYQSRILATVELRIRLQALRKQLIDRLLALFPAELSVQDRGIHWRTCLRHKNGLKISVRACRSVLVPPRGWRWVIEPYLKENSFVTVLALLNSDNTAFEKLVMVPTIPYRGKITVGARDDVIRTGSKLTDLKVFLASLDEMRIRRRAKRVA